LKEAKLIIENWRRHYNAPRPVHRSAKSRRHQKRPSGHDKNGRASTPAVASYVRAKAVDALQNGFRPIVSPEAVDDRSLPAYGLTLLDLQAKYADVIALDPALLR
jgi:hypothetical protein